MCVCVNVCTGRSSSGFLPRAASLMISLAIWCWPLSKHTHTRPDTADLIRKLAGGLKLRLRSDVCRGEVDRGGNSSLRAGCRSTGRRTELSSPQEVSCPLKSRKSEALKRRHGVVASDGCRRCGRSSLKFCRLHRPKTLRGKTLTTLWCKVMTHGRQSRLHVEKHQKYQEINGQKSPETPLI